MADFGARARARSKKLIAFVLPWNGGRREQGRKNVHALVLEGNIFNCN